MRKIRIAQIGTSQNGHGTVIWNSLIGAHTMARPKHDSSDRLWTEKDDLKTLFNLIRGGRLNFKDMISEVHSPAKAQEVFTRLAEEKNFPIGVLFDWNLI